MKPFPLLCLVCALASGAEIPASSFGIKCDGTTIDTAAFARAGAASDISIGFPDGATCLTAGFVLSGSNARWHGNGATLKHIGAAGDLVRAAYVTGVSIEGFVLDAAGVAGSQLIYADHARVELRGNSFINTGNLLPSLGAVQLWQSGGVVAGNVVAGLQGVGILHDATSTAALRIEDNEISGSSQNAIALFGWPGSRGGPITVRGNYLHDIASASGDGPKGNCVVVFQSYGPVDIYGNTCERATYSAFRLNASRGVLVHSNHVLGTGEVAAYAELGAEGNDFYNNDFEDVWAGISLTNLTDRALGLPNTARGNRINGATAYGIHVEGDVASDNIITGAPWGVRVGFGGTGAANVVEHNVCSGPGLQACVVVDADLYALPVSRIRSNVSSGPEVVSVALSAPGPVVLRVLPASVLVTDQSLAFAWLGSMANGSTVFSPDAKCGPAGAAGVFIKRVNGASLCQ